MSVGATLFGGEDAAKDTSLAYNVSGRAARDAAEDAASQSADAQQRGLDYMMEREATPQAFREAALTGIGGEYGMTLDQEGNVISDGMSVVDRAKASPLYAGIMSGQEAGEESIMRNAAMTGGLRSGSTSYNLADFNTQLQNQALMTSYQDQMQGLQGLAGLPSYATDIANRTAGIGETYALGTTAGAQSRQEGTGNMFGLLSMFGGGI